MAIGNLLDVTQAYLDLNRAFTNALQSPSEPPPQSDAAPADEVSLSERAQNLLGSLQSIVPPSIALTFPLSVDFSAPAIGLRLPNLVPIDLPVLRIGGGQTDAHPDEQALEDAVIAELVAVQQGELPASANVAIAASQGETEGVEIGFEIPTKEEQEELITEEAQLPDLIPWMHYSKNARVRVDRQTGERILNFAGTTSNLGDGPLRMGIGGTPEEDYRPAHQIIENADGSTSDPLVGSFYWHAAPGHNHYHFDDFVEYRLREINEDGSPGDIVGTSHKAGFCLMDSLVRDSDHPNAPLTPRFRGLNCYKGIEQGISPGWADHYPARQGLETLDGQSINIEGLPSGEYFLEIAADPNDVIHESDETNNVGRVKVTI